MTTIDLDATRIEEFAGRMGGILNDALLALSISLGHQTGLFDTMAGLPPSTSADIAEAADLDERYVREVLGALITGGITTYDADPARTPCPASTPPCSPEPPASATWPRSPSSSPCSGPSSRTSCACFREGGGVPYSKFPTFHRLMAELSKETIDATLVDGTLALVDGLRERLEAGIEVADVGCGAGYAMNVLGRAFPNSRFTGFDFSEEAIVAARAQAEEWGLANVTFEVRDAAELDITGRLRPGDDVRRRPRPGGPAAVLRGLSNALKPDGVYLCVDVAASSHLEENLDHPLGPAIYTISTFHCMTVSLALDGAGLGAAWGEQTAHAMLADAGFTSVDTHRLEGDPFNVYYVARKA